MLDFSTWTNENTLSLITLFFAVLGGLFAYMQWRRSVKLQRAEFINVIVDKLRFDPEVVKAKRIVDCENWYNQQFHSGGEKDLVVDGLFAYLVSVNQSRPTKRKPT